MATPSKTGALLPPKAPNLPIGPVDYSQQYQDEFGNVLRLYFNQIDNFCQPFASNTGGQYLKFPNGSFYNTANVTAAANSTAYTVPFTQTVTSNAVIIDSGNNANVITEVSGIYNFQFSAQIIKTSGSTQAIWMWPRVNGSDIANSNTKLALTGGTNTEALMALNYVLPMNAGDVFQLMFAVSDTSVKLLKEPAVSFGPAIPPVILTVSFVSALY
jgi:hypothetical protein